MLNAELKDRIQKLRETIFTEKRFQFRNCIQMSGWVIKKPTFTTYKDRPCCYFILFMIHQQYYYSYRCSTFNEKVIEEIKKQNSVFAITCLGKCINTKDNKMIYAISDAELSYIMEYPFVESEINNDNND